MFSLSLDEIFELLVEFLDCLAMPFVFSVEILDFLLQVVSSRHCTSGPSGWIDLDILIFGEGDFAESLRNAGDVFPEDEDDLVASDCCNKF